MTKKKCRLGLILLAAACLLGASGCSQQGVPAAPAQGGASAGASSGDENTVYGKVTAVDGDKITIAVGTLNLPDRQSGDGSARQGPGPGSRGGSFSRPEAGLQSGGNGRRQGGSSGSGSGGAQGRQSGSGGFDLLTPTGESRTITIADPGVLSFQRMGRGAGGGDSSGAAQSASSSPAASLSDVKVGTVLRVDYRDDGQTISSVVILGGAFGGSGRAGASSGT